MKSLLLIALMQIGSLETIYENHLYQLKCVATYINGTPVEYTIYCQNGKYSHLIDLVNLYTGDNPVGFMDEVLAFVDVAKMGESKEVQGVTIMKERQGFYLYKGSAYKGFSEKAFLKIRNKIEGVIN